MRGFTYKDWLIEDLRSLERNRGAIEQMMFELQTIEAEFASIKATNYDKMPTASGVNIAEERMLTAIAKKTELEADLKATSLHVEDMDRLLRTLPDDELLVVKRMLVNRERGAVENLMGELNVEKSQIYRIRDRALLHLAKSRYGQGFKP